MRGDFEAIAKAHIATIKKHIKWMEVFQRDRYIEVSDPNHGFRPWIIYRNGDVSYLEQIFRDPAPERIFITDAYGSRKIFISASAVHAYRTDTIPTLFYDPYGANLSTHYRYSLAGFRWPVDMIAQVKGTHLGDPIAIRASIIQSRLYGRAPDNMECSILQEKDTKMDSISAIPLCGEE